MGTTILIVSTMTYSVWSLQCYNCGYRKVNGGEAEELPEMTYCNDFAKPTDIVVNCTQPGDCCASMKEEIDRLDENGNKNYTELIAKHGCGSDIGNIEGRHHYCSEHPDSRFNVDDATLPTDVTRRIRYFRSQHQEEEPRQQSPPSSSSAS